MTINLGSGKWLRTFFGILAGSANLYANGHSFKQILVSLGVTALGAITQVTSQSTPPAAQ